MKNADAKSVSVARNNTCTFNGIRVFRQPGFTTSGRCARWTHPSTESNSGKILKRWIGNAPQAGNESSSPTALERGFFGFDPRKRLRYYPAWIMPAGQLPGLGQAPPAQGRRQNPHALEPAESKPNAMGHWKFKFDNMRMPLKNRTVLGSALNYLLTENRSRTMADFCFRPSPLRFDATSPSPLRFHLRRRRALARQDPR